MRSILAIGRLQVRTVVAHELVLGTHFRRGVLLAVTTTAEVKLLASENEKQPHRDEQVSQLLGRRWDKFTGAVPVQLRMRECECNPCSYLKQL
jgi:hypothetical protein